MQAPCDIFLLEHLRQLHGMRLKESAQRFREQVVEISGASPRHEGLRFGDERRRQLGFDACFFHDREGSAPSKHGRALVGAVLGPAARRAANGEDSVAVSVHYCVASASGGRCRSEAPTGRNVHARVLLPTPSGMKMPDGGGPHAT